MTIKFNTKGLENYLPNNILNELEKINAKCLDSKESKKIQMATNTVFHILDNVAFENRQMNFNEECEMYDALNILSI